MALAYFDALNHLGLMRSLFPYIFDWDRCIALPGSITRFSFDMYHAWLRRYIAFLNLTFLQDSMLPHIMNGLVIGQAYFFACHENQEYDFIKMPIQRMEGPLLATLHIKYLSDAVSCLGVWLSQTGMIPQFEISCLLSFLKFYSRVTSLLKGGKITDINKLVFDNSTLELFDCKPSS